MKVHYLVEIVNPEHHYVKVRLRIEDVPGESLKMFLPSWSPGSYLMREYARHIRWIQATQANGEVLFHTQLAKGVWEIDWRKSAAATRETTLEVTYEVYCHELTVRTSHVDASHAFLHGPSYLVGILDHKLQDPTIEFRFPPSWSRLSTGLRDVSLNRERFLYQAADYDELVDAPVEIGCHETDGFDFLGRPHQLAFYGVQYPHRHDLKADIKKIVETVARHFDNDLPYKDYLFLTHFVPKLYGGLEHLNSTALHFDGRKLGSRKDYISYLSLVAHEYFHLWNVKRIRPRELGPFDYCNEAYTTLLWLAEGLTSFVDDLFVYRAELATLEEYLDIVKGNLETYLSTPGRRYHSLEQSSFNAWIKLYRPDENSKNSTVSYYLKGGLVFTVLQALLVEQGRSVDELLSLLWKDFKEHTHRGLVKEDIYRMVREIGGDEILTRFTEMVESTTDIDFESAFRKLGCELKWSEPSSPWIGADFEYTGERVFVKTISLDSPAQRGGLNVGDEVLFLNELRFEKGDVDKLGTLLVMDRPYGLVISRLGKLERVELIPGRAPRQLKEISIVDRGLAERAFSFSPRPVLLHKA